MAVSIKRIKNKREPWLAWWAHRHPPWHSGRSRQPCHQTRPPWRWIHRALWYDGLHAIVIILSSSRHGLHQTQLPWHDFIVCGDVLVFTSLSTSYSGLHWGDVGDLAASVEPSCIAPSPRCAAALPLHTRMPFPAAYASIPLAQTTLSIVLSATTRVGPCIIDGVERHHLMLGDMPVCHSVGAHNLRHGLMQGVSMLAWLDG